MRIRMGSETCGAVPSTAMCRSTWASSNPLARKLSGLISYRDNG